jgi:hypothetical protein
VPTTPSSSPRRDAMLSALLRPGTPHNRRYVGASAASSNSTLAFSNCPGGPSYFSAVNALHGTLFGRAISGSVGGSTLHERLFGRVVSGRVGESGLHKRVLNMVGRWVGLARKISMMRTLARSWHFHAAERRGLYCKGTA